MCRRTVKLAIVCGCRHTTLVIAVYLYNTYLIQDRLHETQQMRGVGVHFTIHQSQAIQSSMAIEMAPGYAPQMASSTVTTPYLAKKPFQLITLQTTQTTLESAGFRNSLPSRHVTHLNVCIQVLKVNPHFSQTPLTCLLLGTVGTFYCGPQTAVSAHHESCSGCRLHCVAPCRSPVISLQALASPLSLIPCEKFNECEKIDSGMQ